MLRRADELAAVIATEVGMPRHIAVGAQVRLPAAVIDKVADVGAGHPWEERVGAATVVREPAGVVAAITPWNFPSTRSRPKVAPALLAGCTIVLKPSEVAPLNAFVFAECTQAAGDPRRRVQPGVRLRARGREALRHHIRWSRWCR